MASASDEDLKAMVKQWQDLQKAQKETSETIAEFKTNFTEQMSELTQELQEDIKALDMSADAAESGRATIQAFIDSAASMESQVRTAYAKLGAVASAALGSASGSYGPVNTHGWLPDDHYASGTDYASAGLALVGEYGPELVMMRGGEKVLSAQETAAIYDPPSRNAGDGYIVTFSPVYTISGNMAPEEVESVLREHDDSLRQQLEDLLTDIEADRARRAYR